MQDLHAPVFLLLVLPYPPNDKNRQNCPPDNGFPPNVTPLQVGLHPRESHLHLPVDAPADKCHYKLHFQDALQMR